MDPQIIASTCQVILRENNRPLMLRVYFWNMDHPIWVLKFSGSISHFGADQNRNFAKF